jgi:aerobic-type carbon monoxide dehydrogenase small subunit (CoxS/CutS family)
MNPPGLSRASLVALGTGDSIPDPSPEPGSTRFGARLAGRTTLAAHDLWVLRDHLDLVGAKFGCGFAQCTADSGTLHERSAAPSTSTVHALVGRSVTTIEGLAKDGNLHPLQGAWISEDVAQCGYCQAGQIMSAAALLAKNASPTDAEIDAGMAGNLCRCGTYLRIRRAIQHAAGRNGGAA